MKKMKILLGSTTLVGLLFAGPAQAADMPVKAPERAPDCCVYANFGGWYIGIHGGGGVATDYGATLVDDATTTSELIGVNGRRTFGLGGVHGGWNFQTGQGLVGIEGDYSWVSARSSITVLEPDTPG